MSHTRRDKDKWKVRKLCKQLSEMYPRPLSLKMMAVIQQSADYLQVEKQIESIRAKYGRGLRVNAGRKGSTRNTLALLRRVQRRIKKRGERHRNFTAMKGRLLDGE